MPNNRPRRKDQQFYTLCRDIVAARDTTHILFLGLSNDWEELLAPGGLFINIKASAARRWEGLSVREMCNFNHNKRSLLTARGDKYIKRKMQAYVQQLEKMFGGSSASVVFHCSILERLIYSLPLLPMFFAILNSYLQDTLKTAQIYNRFGQKLSFKFIRVSEQFYSAGDASTLFTNSKGEVSRGVMTHRTHDAYRDLFIKIHSEMLKYMNSH